MITNEQSLMQDYAERTLADAGVTGTEFGWSGPRVLVMWVDQDQWAKTARAVTLVQARAADAGFKTVMRAPVRSTSS